MDSSTGYIYPPETLRRIEAQNATFRRLISRVTPEEAELIEAEKARVDQFLGRVVPMEVEPTRVQMERTPPRVGRNEPCPCGSGKKFKKCCLNHQ